MSNEIIPLGKQRQSEQEFEINTNTDTNIVGLIDKGNLIFPFTHSSALIGPISDTAYDINNDIYEDDLDRVKTNGIYYSTAQYSKYSDCFIQVISAGDQVFQIKYLTDTYCGSISNSRLSMTTRHSIYLTSDKNREYTMYIRAYDEKYKTWSDWTYYSPLAKNNFNLSAVYLDYRDELLLVDSNEAEMFDRLLKQAYAYYDASDLSSDSDYRLNITLNMDICAPESQLFNNSSTSSYITISGPLHFNKFEDDGWLFEGICNTYNDGNKYEWFITMKWSPTDYEYFSSDTYTFTCTQLESNEPASALPEVKIDTTEPTEENITLWVDTTETSPTEKDTPKTSTLTVTEITKNITLPINYTVGNNSLEVYYDGEKLIKATKQDGTDGHYIEIGTTDNTSNEIQITNDWDIEIRKCI